MYSPNKPSDPWPCLANSCDTFRICLTAPRTRWFEDRTWKLIDKH